MTCAEALEALLLGDPEARAHLASCASCRAAWARLEAQERLLRDHFTDLRRPAQAPRRSLFRPLAAAAALLVAVSAAWLLRPGGDGGPPPAYGDVRVLKRGYAVTVLNQGMGLVRDRRSILNLRPGMNRFRLQDIPSGIVPDSVRFLSETDPVGCKVLEQDYEYDLADRESLLRRYVDREVGFEVRGERRAGVLLSPSGVVRMDGEVRAAFPGQPLLPEPPGGLLTRPALAWVLDAPRESRHETVVSYLTGGMSWKADYVLTLKGAATLDLDGWASVTNESGAAYEDATLKLLAGDVHLEPLLKTKTVDLGLDLERPGALAGGFEEKAFAECHLYTLGRPTTLRDRETKQIDLLGARGVPFRTELVYEPAVDRAVLSFLVFRNAKEASLGMPLPAGTVRILAAGPDGEAEQVALASIGHTPKDEEIRIPRGRALEMAAERRRSGPREAEIRLRNHGAGVARVKVLERLRPGERILESSHPHLMKDASTAVFEIDVAPDTETLIRYTKEEQP